MGLIYLYWGICSTTVCGLSFFPFSSNQIYMHKKLTGRTDEKRLISAEMRFRRRTAGYTHWDQKETKTF
jgi:hypothetical protein